MLSADKATVYTGFWTNWARDRILGSTLTLSSRGGLYLVAFLALFVRWSGSHLWSIICFTTFRIRTNAEVRDVLFHDQQVLLRNSGSSTNALWQLARITARWRKTTHEHLTRSLSLVLLAGLHAVVFAACGIFVAKVSGTSDDVLLRSHQCGTLDDTQPLPESDTSFNSFLSTFAIENENIRISSNYVASCFRNTSSTPANCESYARKRPRWDLTEQATCPFTGDMCYSAPHMTTANLAVHLDSSLINSDLDLGINAPTSERITIRKTLTCAPIKTEGFSRTVRPANASSDWVASVVGNSSYWPVAFDYGPATGAAALAAPATFLFNPGTLLETSSQGMASPYGLK